MAARRACCSRRESRGGERRAVADGPRGLVIAAPATGHGKTTLTLGLIAALRARGLSVGALKIGPDFIDPGFHLAAGAARSYNLDHWGMRAATRARLID